MEISRRCDVCNIGFHRATFAKHLRSKNIWKMRNKVKRFSPEWLFKEEYNPI